MCQFYVVIFLIGSVWFSMILMNVVNMMVICWLFDCYDVQNFLCFFVVIFDRQIDMLLSLMFVEKFCNSWLSSMSIGVSMLIVVQFGIVVIVSVLIVISLSVRISFLW